MRKRQRSLPGRCHPSTRGAHWSATRRRRQGREPSRIWNKMRMISVMSTKGPLGLRNSLLLEHDDRILFDIAHVNLVQHILLFDTQPPELWDDLRLQETLVAIVGIIGRLEGFVVEAMTSHPLVNATLGQNDKSRTRVLKSFDVVYACLFMGINCKR